MQNPVNDPALVAACGLYCGSCKSYLKGKCEGCAKNEKASWCKIRRCVNESEISTCAACDAHPDPTTCLYFNNFMGRVMGVLFNSNRAACIARIKEVGLEAFADEMAAAGKQTLPRR